MSTYFKQATIDQFYEQVAKYPTTTQLFDISTDVEHNRQLLLPYLASIFKALRLKYHDKQAVNAPQYVASSIIDDVESYITSLMAKSNIQQWNFWTDFTFTTNLKQTDELFMKHCPQNQYDTNDLQTTIDNLDSQLAWFFTDDARFNSRHNFIRQCLSDQLASYRDYLQQVATDSNNIANVSQLCCWSVTDRHNLQQLLQQPVDGDLEAIQILHLKAVQDFIQNTYRKFVSLIADVFNIIEHLKCDLFFNNLDNN